MRFELRGADVLQDILKEAAKLEVAKQAIIYHGAELLKEAKRQATAGVAFKKGYSTGFTRKHMAHELQDGGLTAVVYPISEYAPYVEFGTRKMDAEPFMKPALDKVKRGFLKDMGRIKNA